MQKQLAEEAIRHLRDFPEVEKLVLFGSVASGRYRPTADIDLAFICQEEHRWFPLDDEGTPIGLMDRIDSALGQIKNDAKIRFHISFYWLSEFEKGIELYSGKKFPPDMLHEVGKVVYESGLLA